MIHHQFTLFLSLILTITCHAAQKITVHLTPPKLDTASIAVKASCDRPRRTDGIHIALEKQYEKTIVHCYGHGGSGFTTLFGSIEKAVALLLDQNLNKQTPIAIIGSGCMGLTAALELYRHGFTAITIYTKEIYQLPSWRAGGFFDPGTGKEDDPAGLERLKLGLATYATLYAIEHGKHPYLTSTIVRRLPIYFPASMKMGVEVLEEINAMPASLPVTLDFGNGVLHEGYKRQETYFINVTELMQQLWAQIEKLNIPVVTAEITTFTDCKEPIIYNCTGLGSATLNNDQKLYPARGHFFMLTQEPGTAPLDYMLFTEIGDADEWIYLFPKPRFMNADGTCVECCAMLGGTNINCGHMNTEELKQLDAKEFNKLDERARQFFYGKNYNAQQSIATRG